MQKANLSDNHFNWTTGYGYNDLGREKLKKFMPMFLDVKML